MHGRMAVRPRILIINADYRVIDYMAVLYTLFSNSVNAIVNGQSLKKVCKVPPWFLPYPK